SSTRATPSAVSTRPTSSGSDTSRKASWTLGSPRGASSPRIGDTNASRAAGPARLFQGPVRTGRLDAMEYRRLGKTDLRASVVGFGCWAMGGRSWGKVDDGACVAAIHRALDLGVNLFDTAPAYGFGHSEELLGKAL